MIRIRINYFLLTMFLAGFMMLSASGQSTEKYDQEINRIIGKILQYPDRTKDLGDLKVNFDQANETDRASIVALLQTGQPDIWKEIYLLYKKMDNRQKLIAKIPEKSIQMAGIEIKDYEKELRESRYKATAYFYALGEKLMKSQNPEDVRKAYLNFLQVAELDGSFKDLDKMLRKAILKGSTNMEFELQNRTGKKISDALIDQLTIIIWEFKRAKYGQAEPAEKDNSFSFILRVILDDLQIGPDQFKEIQYQEERDIFSGEMVVDTIQCVVFETKQLKKAQLSGSMEYIDKQTGKVVNRIPVRVESVFANSYGILQGDPDAAGEETRELLKAKKAAYPSDEQMILDATEEFTKKAREIILVE